MTDLSNLDAKSVINETGLSEYKQGIEFFYLQLVHLNTSIYIVDQILNFPFGLFVGTENTIFFGMVVRNFFDAGLLVVTRLATDQGQDLYTFMRFKNRVRELVRPEIVGLFDERLRKYRFDRNTAALLEKARRLRNERVGHANEDVILGISEGA